MSTATWPTLTEEQAAALLARLSRQAGVPADWWGEDNEVAAFTHVPELACRAAELLAQRDLECSYASLAGAVEVEGPAEVVLIGTGDLEEVATRPAVPGDGYALLMCRVSPVYPGVA